ncbi:hypothetical protein [Shinella zoogloeoides]|uniref:hypothetical protein n=1 Tax=Shinella zoogloeoides TaxID=352475 RepID=UPI0028A8CB77|nr:hypothetical protein [Shinella zoogloeoides]
MSEYRYTRYAFKDGTRHEELCTLTSGDVIVRTGRDNRAAFLEMVNGWNRAGLVGVPHGGPVYVFVAED